jgi:vacuolar-type H+-ATPase subunit I/STV1
MIKPRKMKHVALSVLSRDADAVIEYLGRWGIMHFSKEEEAAAPEKGRAATSPEAKSGDEGANRNRIQENLERLRANAA